MLLNMVGAGAVAGFPSFTYSGQHQLIDDGKVSGKQNWRIKFLTSGTLKFLDDAPASVQAFLVGAGGTNNEPPGAGGGYTTMGNVQITLGTAYSIVIGAGPSGKGTGGSTTAFGLTAAGGQSGDNYAGGKGGSGGGARFGARGGSNGSNGGTHEGTGGTGQGRTTREFGESSGTLYAGGGGGGTWGDTSPGAGGAGGGGTGGNTDRGMTATNGGVNTGGGGGGRGSAAAGTNFGKGGSGIVVIRNMRWT